MLCGHRGLGTGEDWSLVLGYHNLISKGFQLFKNPLGAAKLSLPLLLRLASSRN